jgi:hypothetical protein
MISELYRPYNWLSNCLLPQFFGLDLLNFKFFNFPRSLPSSLPLRPPPSLSLLFLPPAPPQYLHLHFGFIESQHILRIGSVSANVKLVGLRKIGGQANTVFAIFYTVFNDKNIVICKALSFIQISHGGQADCGDDHVWIWSSAALDLVKCCTFVAHLKSSQSVPFSHSRTRPTTHHSFTPLLLKPPHSGVQIVHICVMGFCAALGR